MFIRNITIIKVEIYHEELSVKNGKTVFVYFLWSAKFYFPVFWCLFIGLLSNLPDMTGGPTVFPEVDRSVKQIKFHLKS